MKTAEEKLAGAINYLRERNLYCLDPGSNAPKLPYAAPEYYAFAPRTQNEAFQLSKETSCI